MRIWDVPVSDLCRVHLLGEHRELHALWTILTTDRKGYRSHPETKRWIGKLTALSRRHEEQVAEMQLRGYTHASPLEKLERSVAADKSIQDSYVNTITEQQELLKNKPCACYQNAADSNLP